MYLYNTLKCNGFRYNIEPIVNLHNKNEVEWVELLCKNNLYNFTTQDWRNWYSHIYDIIVSNFKGNLPYISVNVDTAHLLDDHILKTIESWKGYPICLEWTEQRFYCDPASFQRAGDNLEKLCKANDFCLVLDDVGKGEDCLRRMFINSPDFVKFDGNILKRAFKDKTLDKILRNYVLFFQKMKIPYVVEWIETIEHLFYARDIGAKYGQGFYFKEEVLCF